MALLLAGEFFQNLNRDKFALYLFRAVPPPPFHSFNIMSTPQTPTDANTARDAAPSVKQKKRDDQLKRMEKARRRLRLSSGNIRARHAVLLAIMLRRNRRDEKARDLLRSLFLDRPSRTRLLARLLPLFGRLGRLRVRSSVADFCPF